MRAAKILSTRQIELNTKPQQITNEILDELNIKYTREKQFDYWSIDNYLDEYNLCIEVMGDFWHASPIKYSDISDSKIQTKQVYNDFLKHDWILDRYKINILYLWEHDIITGEDKCKSIINEYIKNNGILDNYDSFNYHMDNNVLTLNDNIIYPLWENCA